MAKNLKIPKKIVSGKQRRYFFANKDKLSSKELKALRDKTRGKKN
jgi:hypothetical protein